MFEQLPQKPNDFYSLILFETLVALKLNQEDNNFDANRFNQDGMDQSRTFKAVEHAFYFDWFFRNSSQLYATYQLFPSDREKRLFLHLIAYRLAGHLSVRIPNDFESADSAYETLLNQGIGQPSRLELNGHGSGVQHFDFELNGSRYVTDCRGLRNSLFRRQYFFNDGVQTVQPEPGDVVIDGGACLGDTAVTFSNAVGSQGKVFSFDPVSEHIEVLNHNAEQADIQNIVVCPCGVGDQEVEGQPISLNRFDPGFSVFDKPVPIRSLDSLFAEGAFEKVDFIKLDVEGFELNALAGAKNCIHRFHPKLAVSLYHKPDDIFEIPAWIQKHFPFYRFRLGHYTIHPEETVLYAYDPVRSARVESVILKNRPPGASGYSDTSFPHAQPESR